MPLYEYKCNGCGEVFEVMQRFSDAPLSTHGTCGGDVERLLSAPALQFKGSGWYITDYARSGGGNGRPAKAETSESKPDSGASSSTTSTDKK